MRIPASFKHICVIVPTLTALLLASPPARAIIVYDPANHAQTLLTAIRTLAMINNQLQQLRNEAQMLTNWTHDLDPLLASVDPQLQAALQQIQMLKANLRGIKLQVTQTQAAITNLFPANMTSASRGQLASGLLARWQAAKDAANDALVVQAQISENLDQDGATLQSLMQRSLSASGNLEAAQVGNELTAFSAKQTMALTNMLAVQGREASIDRARILQGEEQGRVMRKTFIGTACAYTVC
jgi:P-type conjugative transfer protein TrbJ